MDNGFGEALRKAREERGLELEQVSGETNISVHYLDALEKELIASFPSESYLVGFLRNYAEYLNLNAEQLITMYRAIKTQISAAPLDLLLEPKRKFPVYVVVGAVMALALVAAGTVLVINSNAKRQAVRDKVVYSLPERKTYKVEDKPIQKRLYVDDKIEIELEGADAPVTLTVKETLGALTLDTPTGVQIVELGEESELDLDGVVGGELSVFLSDISKTDSARGAEVQLLRIFADGKRAVAVAPVEPEIAPELGGGSGLVSETTESGFKRTVIFESPSAYPITLNATFRSQCLFRYEVDLRTTVEDFYSANQTVSFSANNRLRLWMSNANAVKMQIIGGGKSVDLELGRPGQVLVEDVKWIREDDKYKLVVMDVE